MAEAAPQVQFANRQQCDDALKEVRKDASGTNWALFGYQPGTKNVIVFQQTGQGNIDELKTHLKEDEIQYALLRVTDQIDNSVTVKFAFIWWVGERVKINQKALVTTHKGEITSWRGQAHIDLYASTVDELASLMEKVTDASGTSNRVLDESKQKRVAPSPAATASKASASSGSTGGFNFEDEDNIRSAIKAVRAGETNWALLSYQGTSNVVRLAGTGSGGLSELVSHLEPTSVSYGLLRVEDIVDQHKTFKFVLINWIGEEVPTVRQGRLATHKAQILSIIGQFHNDVFANNLRELTEEIVMQKVKDASGTSNRVKEGLARPVTSGGFTPSRPKEPAFTRKESTGSAGKPVGQLKTVANCQIANEQEGKNAILAVRKDTDATNWALFGYDSPNSNTITLVSTGSGDLEELRTHMDDNSVLYAYYRNSDVYEGHTTVKFVLIIWIGEGVPVVRKARIATHKGNVTEFIGQYHVDFTASNQGELREELIKKKIQDASGSAVHVK